MNEHSDLFAHIDRLATGDLEGPARRELFTWLDREPSGWRRCALALLEARELEQALDGWQAEAAPTVRSPSAPAVPRFRRITRLTLAASLLIAFSLGVVARGVVAPAREAIVELPKPANREPPLKTSSESPPAVAKETNNTSGKSVTSVAAVPPSAARADLIPPYVRSQWERRGFQVTSRPARLPVVLPDGRRVIVPVDEFQLNYVGQRTY
ncbi:MAG TPA: hypothetical protein PK867_17415 [Pirellulales bacterium]|nr:hypothetical protein [Pirellulales bacterium]